jgi:lysophospholipase L1-like esterase
VAEQVAAYQPDICLVQLGFNDLGWRMCGPGPTLASIGDLIEEARSAKPDLKFAVANVPQRTDIPGREDLPRDTDLYNHMLVQEITHWNTPKSPVALVCFCENYSCELLCCRAP